MPKSKTPKLKRRPHRRVNPLPFAPEVVYAPKAVDPAHPLAAQRRQATRDAKNAKRLAAYHAERALQRLAAEVPTAEPQQAAEANPFYSPEAAGEAETPNALRPTPNGSPEAVGGEALPIRGEPLRGEPIGGSAGECIKGEQNQASEGSRALDGGPKVEDEQGRLSSRVRLPEDLARSLPGCDELAEVLGELSLRQALYIIGRLTAPNLSASQVAGCAGYSISAKKKAQNDIERAAHVEKVLKWAKMSHFVRMGCPEYNAQGVKLPDRETLAAWLYSLVRDEDKDIKARLDASKQLREMYGWSAPKTGMDGSQGDEREVLQQVLIQIQGNPTLAFTGQGQPQLLPEAKQPGLTLPQEGVCPESDGDDNQLQ